MSTTYVASSGRDQLHRAQAEMHEHLLPDAAGRCRTCGEIEPCTARNTLIKTILIYGNLPRRRPGLTHRPDTTPRSGGRGWFDSASKAGPAA